jgi:hypothetical protein
VLLPSKKLHPVARARTETRAIARQAGIIDVPVLSVFR